MKIGPSLDQLYASLRGKQSVGNANKTTAATKANAPSLEAKIRDMALKLNIDKTVTPDLLRHQIVHNIVLEKFGKTTLNDAKFGLIVEKISEDINSDPELDSLLTTIMREFVETHKK